MIFQSPELDDADLAVLAYFNAQRAQLRAYAQSSPKRWMGLLRRNTFARGILASNAIDGIQASMENVLAAIENEEPAGIERDAWLATKGCRDAMVCINQAATDPHFELSRQFLKSLHFMVTGRDLTVNPGQWRPGPIHIVNRATGKIVHEGPDAALVNSLMQELVDYLRSPLREPTIVRAAMAHLNLTMIHPFRSGNGRVARALQTLVLAREGELHPAFSGIEEWFAEAPDYFAVLAEVGHGAWRPECDARPWLRFCLKAHCHQAAVLIRRHAEYEALDHRIEAIVRDEGLPDRAFIPLFDAALGLATTNGWYRVDTQVSEIVASRDLRRLTELDLLVPHGEKRGRSYRGSKRLLSIRKAVQKQLGTDMPFVDPYEIMPDMDLRSLYMEPPRDLSFDPRFPGF